MSNYEIAIKAVRKRHSTNIADYTYEEAEAIYAHAFKVEMSAKDLLEVLVWAV